MKNFLFLSFLVISLTSSLFATDGADLLGSLTNGKLSDNSPGVKVLSLKEAKQVKGGYYFERFTPADNYGVFRSYSYLVTSDSDKKLGYASIGGSNELAEQMGFEKGTLIVARYRVVNGGKQYYLTAYLPNGNAVGPASWIANKVLAEFKQKF